MSGEKKGVSKGVSEIRFKDQNGEKSMKQTEPVVERSEIEQGRLLYRAWECPCETWGGPEEQDTGGRGKPKEREQRSRRGEKKGEIDEKEEEEGPNIINPLNSKQIGLRQAGLPAALGVPLRGHRYFVLCPTTRCLWRCILVREPVPVT
ncbi:hypothetical protein TEQG_08644 [Trichophyton equinum CBS 127.97]|uniref:Uncharacterized protein n=1 Tax=Trichophyton equinum (strain ATCC MYA-4606 / CBS 127.97) TaxID=559882 RepID=F2PPR4_TRIEC|nr:hypothetical protein TEQG_08644 [Trichophyton equinum CBS 127.97]